MNAIAFAIVIASIHLSPPPPADASGAVKAIVCLVYFGCWFGFLGSLSWR